jgi:hypothetical protein
MTRHDRISFSIRYIRDEWKGKLDFFSSLFVSCMGWSWCGCILDLDGGLRWELIWMGWFGLVWCSVVWLIDCG